MRGSCSSPSSARRWVTFMIRHETGRSRLCLHRRLRQDRQQRTNPAHLPHLREHPRARLGGQPRQGQYLLPDELYQVHIIRNSCVSKTRNYPECWRGNRGDGTGGDLVLLIRWKAKITLLFDSLPARVRPVLQTQGHVPKTDSRAPTQPAENARLE